MLHIHVPDLTALDITGCTLDYKADAWPQLEKFTIFAAPIRVVLSVTVNDSFDMLID